MKRIWIIAVAAATICVSCNKEMQQEQVPESSGPEVTLPGILHASIEKASTKAGFEYDAAGKTYSHFWNEGDRMAYFAGDDRPNLYECTDVDNGGFTLKTASHLAAVRATYAKNYAIYPDNVLISSAGYNDFGYDEELVELNELSNGTGYPISTTNPPVLNVVVPRSEQFKDGDLTYGYGNILVAQLDDDATDHIRFQSVMGWLKIQLTGAAPVKQILVQADQTLGTITLSGAGHISFDTDGTPSLTMETDQDLEVYPSKIYNFGTANPVVLDLEVPTPIYLALPPTEFSHGFTVRVTYADGQTTELTTTNRISIERNTVTPMKARQVRSIETTLLPGINLNVALKSLAAGATIASTSNDTYIKEVRVETGSPVTTETEVSVAGSDCPVYASFDDETGIITLHTAAYRVLLNKNSSSAFSRMGSLTAIDSEKLDAANVTAASNMFLYCTKLESYGDLSMPNATNVSSMFSYCSSLRGVGQIDLPLASDVSSMFSLCSSLLSVGDIDFPEATNATYLFNQCNNLASIGEISLPKVTDASYMFSSCQALTSVGDLNLPAAGNISNLFSNCILLNTMGAINAPLATNVSSIFSGCTSLTRTILDFPNAINVSNMFKGCTSLQVVGDINFPKVTNASAMFSGCTALTSIGNISLPLATDVSQLIGTSSSSQTSWPVLLTSVGTISIPSATNVSYLFRGCQALENVTIEIGDNKLGNISYMFDNCIELTSITGFPVASNAITNTEHLFYNCPKLGTVDISGLAGSPTSIAGMFYNCGEFTQISFNSAFLTANCTDMSRLFSNCSKLTAVNADGFNTSNVTTMASMFQNCSQLTELDLSGFNTAKVISFASMFSGCSALTTIGAGTKFVSTVVTSIGGMFNGCSALASVDMSGLSGTLTSDGTLENTFYNCSRLTEIRFAANLYTDAIYSYANIFRGCSSLRQLYIKGFYLGKRSGNDNTGYRFGATMTGVPSGCTVHYTALTSVGNHSGSYNYDIPSMFAFYSTPSTSSFTFTTN